jgi:hypothetical protein
LGSGGRRTGLDIYCRCVALARSKTDTTSLAAIKSQLDTHPAKTSASIERYCGCTANGPCLLLWQPRQEKRADTCIANNEDEENMAQAPEVKTSTEANERSPQRENTAEERAQMSGDTANCPPGDMKN